MYRVHQSKAMAEANESQLPKVHFIEQVYEIPTVSSAWGYAINVYAKAKGYNALVAKTLNKAESTAIGMNQMTTAFMVTPIATHLKGPIELVDTMACKGLAKVEDMLPAIKLPPEELLSTTKSYVNTKLEPAKNYGTEKIEKLKVTITVVRHYGYSTANIVLSTKIGHLALDSVDAILNAAENYVDQYLPVKDDGVKTEDVNSEGTNKENDGTAEKDLEPPIKAAHSVRRAVKISQRTYRGALEKIHSAQQTTKVLAQNLFLFGQLAQLVNLVHYLNKSTVPKEEELKEQEQEKEKAPH